MSTEAFGDGFLTATTVDVVDLAAGFETGFDPEVGVDEVGRVELEGEGEALLAGFDAALLETTVDAVVDDDDGFAAGFSASFVVPAVAVFLF